MSKIRKRDRDRDIYIENCECDKIVDERKYLNILFIYKKKKN